MDLKIIGRIKKSIKLIIEIQPGLFISGNNNIYYILHQKNLI